MRERTDEQRTTPHDPPEPEIHEATRRRVGPATSHGWGQLRVLRPHHAQPQVGPERRRTVGPVQSATASGFVVLPRRWVVERTFGWLSRHRRLVRDYERLPEHHEAMVLWATTMIMT